MPASVESPEEVCRRFAAAFRAVAPDEKVGVSAFVSSQSLPIHGLRHPPQGETSGWYIWSGELSTDPSFFRPLHARHLSERCPQVVKYLGLGPGWRFLVAPDHEDVWFDESLLRVSP
jgi:hypothetical protein